MPICPPRVGGDVIITPPRNPILLLMVQKSQTTTWDERNLENKRILSLSTDVQNPVNNGICTISTG